MENENNVELGTLRSALYYNEPQVADLIAKVHLEIGGENDYASWHWIVEMKDGTWAYIEGGCDYTGWDCQSHVSVYPAPTREAALAEAPQDQRRAFEEMLAKGIGYIEYTQVSHGGES